MTRGRRTRWAARVIASAIVVGSAALALAALPTGVSASPPVVVITTFSGSGGAGSSAGSGSGLWTANGTTSVVASSVVADGTCDAGITISPTSFTVSGAGSSVPFTVTCTASATPEIRSCQFHAKSGLGQTLGSVTALCINGSTTALAYTGPNPRDLGAPMVGSVGAFVPITITNTGPAMTAISVHLADQDGNFKLRTPCAPGVVGCTLTNVNIGMGASFTVEAQCTPQVAGPLSTKLYVVGGNGARLPAPIDLTCSAGTTTGASLAANPAQLTLHAPVNGSGSTNVRITNGGTAAASITAIAVVGLDSGEWTAMPGDPCTSGSCMLAAGEYVDLELNLSPTAIGARVSTLQITTADLAQPMLDVELTGIGDQGILAFEGTLATPFDIGTFPVGVTGQRTFNLRNNGNVALGPIELSLAAGSGEFAVTPTSLSSLGLPPMVRQITVTCRPATAETFTEMLTITAPTELTTQMLELEVQCTGTTANLYATSAALGEIRRNAGPRTTQIELRTAGPPLTVSAGATLLTPMAGMTVPDLVGTSILFQQTPPTSFALEVDPKQFPDGPITNTISVSAQPAAGATETVEIPVTGQIVTAALEVPTEIMAGSFCVDQPTASTTARIRASGTASILVAQPSMGKMASSPFQLTNGSPAAYPFELPSQQTASIEVTPLRQDLPGMQTDSLVWSTDVGVQGLVAPTTTTVTAEFIATGGAIAPSRVDFGAVAVHLTSAPRTIRIQNCGTDEISLSGVRIEPRDEFRDVSLQPLPAVLLPKQTATIHVEFTPRRPGVRAGTLGVTSSNGELLATLEGFGDGIGSNDGSVRSLYACTCSGSGAPSRGWPIALALVLIVRRRRYGEGHLR